MILAFVEGRAHQVKHKSNYHQMQMHLAIVVLNLRSIRYYDLQSESIGPASVPHLVSVLDITHHLTPSTVTNALKAAMDDSFVYEHSTQFYLHPHISL
jgi:hypothetical protein